MACPHGKPNPADCELCKKKAKAPGPPAPKGPPVPAAASSSSSAVALAAPAIRAGPDTRTAAEWYKRFRTLAKQFTTPELQIVHAALQTLCANQTAFASEAELQKAVMNILLEARRPKLCGKPVVVGIPYRDDRGSEAILDDMQRVRDGTLCDVVALVPSWPTYGRWKPAQILEYLKGKGEKCLLWDPQRPSLRTLCVDAIYISGGPHDHPAMTGEAKNPPKENRAKEADDRHRFEAFIIRCALKENLPVLGVSGGSWRLAVEVEARVERLPAADGIEKRHARNMAEPLLWAHDVEVRDVGMLNQLLQTDNYRLFPGVQSAPQAAPLHANSVHWAQSVIPLLSPLQIRRTARDGDVTEAFEANPQRHHFVMGIQWHPEYAMDQLQGAGIEDARRHRQVLRALGDAGRDGKAATIIQKQMRGFLARKRLAELKEQKAGAAAGAPPKSPPK